MGKPTVDEFNQAIARAKEMRERGDDPDYLAKSLLSLNYRFDQWQKVVKALKNYLRSGMGTTEHARLIKILHEVEALENEGNTDPEFGLD